MNSLKTDFCTSVFAVRGYQQNRDHEIGKYMRKNLKALVQELIVVKLLQMMGNLPKGDRWRVPVMENMPFKKRATSENAVI